MMERIFEKLLWSSRFVTLFAVVFGLIGSIILFVVASFDIVEVFKVMWKFLFHHMHSENMHSEVVSAIIGAVDLYLIALVMLIFSFGVYELFISEIDDMKDSRQSKILEVRSLDHLKDKLGKVVIMVLVVSFFQRVLYQEYTTALEMAYFAFSILALCIGLYFLQKGQH